MYRSDKKKTPRDDRFLSPSFSSTLLDQIYRSIDEGERKSGETNFYRETTGKKHWTETDTKHNNNSSSSLRSEKVVGVSEMDSRKSHQRDGGGGGSDHDQDVLFFSSTSISSDSSSGGFSSSDTESLYGTRSRASCPAPPWPRPVRTSASFRLEKQGTRVFDGFCHSSNAKQGTAIRDEETLIKSKSRALKIYNNLKKVKQPISPGGRLTSFFNSLFATGSGKKSKGTCQVVKAERKAQAASMCSSAASFSRSCLSKTTSSSSQRDGSCDGVKRTVRFYPVEEELKFPAVEKSRVVKEAAREFLKEYHHNQKKNDLVLKDLPTRSRINHNQEEEEEDDDDDDDAASYASSDLFELDHLAVLGNGRYCEELPVYETTNVSTNRAIANGLIV